MYRPAELQESPLEFPIQLTEEIVGECEEKLGVSDCSVQIVEERAEEGMCTVKFKSAIEAQAAAKLMNGRFFAGLRVSATIYDGSFPLPKKTKPVSSAVDEEARLEAFSAFIENGSDDSESGESASNESEESEEQEDEEPNTLE